LLTSVNVENSHFISRNQYKVVGKCLTWYKITTAEATLSASTTTTATSLKQQQQLISEIYDFKKCSSSR